MENDMSFSSFEELSPKQQVRFKVLLTQLREDISQSLGDAIDTYKLLSDMSSSLKESSADKDGGKDHPIFRKFEKNQKKPGTRLLQLCAVVIVLVLVSTFFASESYQNERGGKSKSGNFDVRRYLGVPEKDHFKTIAIGMLLGVVFGFLDNFGLFYGMDSLNPFFYGFASKMMAFHAKDRQQLHRLSNGMMNGLGNTFSDLLGVFLGSAVLVSAKNAFDVDPNFWPIDVFAMLLGCIAGAYLPALAKYGTVNGKKFSIATMCIGFGILVLCMFFPGFRKVGAYKTGGDIVVWSMLSFFAGLSTLLLYLVYKGNTKRQTIVNDVALPSAIALADEISIITKALDDIANISAR